MPTEIETRVLRMLSAIEVPPATAKVIEDMGNEAVTAACAIALGDYSGVEGRVRATAVALLGWMTHPQARETVPMLIDDSDPDIAARALRAAAHQHNDGVVPNVAAMLRREDLSPVLAAEAVDALRTIGGSAAEAALDEYQQATPEALPHRGSTVVTLYLSGGPGGTPSAGRAHD
jgi:hypothetical protein